MSYPALFAQLPLTSGVTLRNRVVMAPMTTWSGNPDGTVADEEIAWMRRRAGWRWPDANRLHACAGQRHRLHR